MISYTFTALSLPVTRHISASTVLRVDLYIGTRLFSTHFVNLTFFGLREEYIALWLLKTRLAIQNKRLWLESERRIRFHFEKALLRQFVIGLVEFS